MLTILIDSTISILSLYFLVKGTEWLMKGAVSLAEIFKISKLAIASTLIAFGTGLPTIAVNLALIFLSPNGVEAALGNALGTNYVNIGLALGIPAFMVTIVTKYEVFEKEIPIFLAITSIVTAFALDGKLTQLEGLILIIGYFVTLFVVYQYAKKEKVNQTNSEEMHIDNSTVGEVKPEGLSISKSIGYILFGLVVLIVFSVLLSQMTPLLSRDFNISEYVLGLTFIGIGTSLPTIVTSIRSAQKGYIDIVLGNVFGGTIANIALGLGLPALFGGLVFNAEAISDTYYFSIYNLIVLFFILIELKLLGKHGTLSRISGIVIVGLYLIYLIGKLI